MPKGKKPKPRRILRAASDELGLTTPKPIKRRAPARKRGVKARSFRARGD